MWWHEETGEGFRRLRPPRRSTASTRFSSSTPAARPASPRASCTPSAGYLLGHVYARRNTSSTCARTTFTGAPPTWAGSPGTRTSCTARWPTARRCSCTRARPTRPRRTAGGSSSSEHKVTILYTAPTAIRAFIKWGDQWPERHDLSSLRLLGTVGEPINPEAWMWFREKIGGGKCPIVDTWWQTETGGHMITPAARRDARPSPARRPCRSSAWTPPSWTTRATRSARTRAASSSSASRGRRCCARSTATTSATPSTYWSEFRRADFYFTGDGARRDEHGNFWIVGPHRRRAQRGRAPPGHERDRERAGGARGGGGGGGGRQARRDQGPGGGGVRDAQGRRRRRARNWRTRSRSTSARASGRSRGRTKSVSPTRCPRRVRARSCAGC